MSPTHRQETHRPSDFAKRLAGDPQLSGSHAKDFQEASKRRQGLEGLDSTLESEKMFQTLVFERTHVGDSAIARVNAVLVQKAPRS